MRQGRQLDEITVNKELLNGALETPAWWKWAVLFFATIVITGFVAFGIQTNKGLGVTGLSRPVF